MYKQIFLVGCAALAIAAIPSYLDHVAEPQTSVKQDLTNAVAINDSAPVAQAMRLAPQTQAQPGYVTGTRTASIPMDHSGHFIGEFRINGRPLKGVVDTGATVVAFNMSTARMLGVILKPGDFTARVATANGETSAAKVHLSRVEIGQIAVEGVEAYVLDDASLDGTLIGMSFMSKLSAYKVEDRTLKLEN
jgi:aspartyl protease family protein